MRNESIMLMSLSLNGQIRKKESKAESLKIDRSIHVGPTFMANKCDARAQNPSIVAY